MPLTADFYSRDEWGDLSEDGEEWDGHTLVAYEGHILSALVKNRMPEESESGLMHWYGERDSVDPVSYTHLWICSASFQASIPRRNTGST